MKIKKIIFILLIALILLPSFSFAQINTEPIKEKMPSILEGWWSTIKTYWEKFGGMFINALKKAWQSAVWFWQKMWGWFKNVWSKYVWPKIGWLWEKILLFFKRKK